MIETLIYMSLFCVGLSISMEQGMILHKPYRWLNRKVKPSWLRKPLFSCMYCFSSFWGGVVFWSLQTDITRMTFVYWVILTVCCVYLNGVLYYGMKEEYKASVK